MDALVGSCGRLDFPRELTLIPGEMTQPARSRHHHTYAEYLAYERDSGLKHEFDAGEIFAMAGGSRRHHALASRVSAALEIGRRVGCVAFQSDQKIRVLATGKATYPDASLVCGPIEGDQFTRRVRARQPGRGPSGTLPAPSVRRMGILGHHGRHPTALDRGDD